MPRQTVATQMEKHNKILRQIGRPALYIHANHKSTSDYRPEFAGGAAQEIFWNTDVGDDDQAQPAGQRHGALEDYGRGHEEARVRDETRARDGEDLTGCLLSDAETVLVVGVEKKVE